MLVKLILFSIWVLVSARLMNSVAANKGAGPHAQNSTKAKSKAS